MFFLLIPLIIVLLLITLWLLAICPSDVKPEMYAPFIGRTYAHRGLHNTDRPENSLSAFASAIQKGYGIELDIRMTKDSKIVVFHDETLLRMCEKDVRLDTLTFDELKKYRLSETEQTIPLLSDVLALADGKVPLIIEFKPCNDFSFFCTKALEILDKYSGAYCIQSFDPRIVHEFKRRRPDIMRGQLSCRFTEKKKSPAGRFILRNLLLNFYSLPHFISYRVQDMRNIGFRLAVGFLRGFSAAWTVQDEETLHKMIDQQTEMIIFENFEPAQVIDYEEKP